MRFKGAICVFALIATLGAAVPAWAARTVTATVPFEFEAGGKLIPAGTYTFEKTGTNGVLRIRDRKGGQSLVMLECVVPAKADDPQVVFDQKNGTHQLKRITTADGISAVVSSAR